MATTAEKIVIPGGGDFYDYAEEQRKMSASQRTIVPVANLAEADNIATVMAADGRAVTDTNPLVVFNTATKSIGVKNSGGWVGKKAYAGVNPSGYTVDGYFAVEPLFDGTKIVTASFSMSRTAGAFAMTTAQYYALGTVFPTEAILAATSGAFYLRTFLTGAGLYQPCTVFVNPTAGSVSIRPDANVTWATGSFFDVTSSWRL